MIRRELRFSIGLMAVLAVPASLTAQEALPLGVEGPVLQFDLSKPFFDIEGVGFVTGVLDATAVLPFGDGGNALFVRAALSHGTLDDVSGSSSTLSNLRVGILLQGEGATHGELHLDLPTVKEFGDDDYATGFAFVADPDRIERWAQDAISAGASVSPARELDSGARIGARLGANVVIPTEDGPETEVLGIAGAFAEMPAGSSLLSVDVGTVGTLTEEGSFAERTLWHMTFSAAFEEVGGAPEVYVRMPLDDELSDALDFVVGARVRVGG